MKSYPRLTEMGVQNPKQIDRFSVNSFDYVDSLRIIYARPKGSILPVSRTYKFPRIQKTAVIDTENRQSDIVMESDPALSAALDELRDITEASEENQDVAREILEEIRLLQEDIAHRSDCIKILVGKIPAE